MGQGHIVIDGFNVIHAWPEFRALLRRRLDAAEGRLLEAVRILHDFEGHALTLVYDGRGGRLSIEHPDEVESLTVVHSASGSTADAVIELLLARAPDTSGWVVASADAAVAQTTLSYGARSISPEGLAAWCEESGRRQASWIERQRKDVD